MKRWCFIVGPARTGTSLVAWLLSQHPDCAVLKDTGIVEAMRWVIEPPSRGIVSRVAFATAEEVQRDEPADWHVWPAPFIGSRRAAAIDADDFVRETCEGIRRAAGDPLVFGDKAPRYCHMWRDILRLWPDAVIIRTKRDEKAVVQSMMRASFVLPEMTDGTEREQSCRAVYRRMRDAAADCPAALTVKLEDLHAQPQAGIEALLDAVGLGVKTYPMQVAVQQIVAPKQKVS